MKCNQNRQVLLFMLLLIATVSVAETPFTSSNLPIIVINAHGSAILDEPKINKGPVWQPRRVRKSNQKT